MPPQLDAPTPATAGQDEREIALPLFDFAALLPTWEAPAPRDENDSAEEALDAFFQTLSPDEQSEIDDQILAQLPAFLRARPQWHGAQIELRRGRRRETLARYPHAQPQ